MNHGLPGKPIKGFAVLIAATAERAKLLKESPSSLALDIKSMRNDRHQLDGIATSLFTITRNDPDLS